MPDQKTRNGDLWGLGYRQDSGLLITNREGEERAARLTTGHFGYIGSLEMREGDLQIAFPAYAKGFAIYNKAADEWTWDIGGALQIRGAAQGPGRLIYGVSHTRGAEVTSLNPDTLETTRVHTPKGQTLHPSLGGHRRSQWSRLLSFIPGQ